MLLTISSKSPSSNYNWNSFRVLYIDIYQFQYQYNFNINININIILDNININKDTQIKQVKIIQDKIKNCHIGYRDSLLTRLLENCLGGNSYTRLICCLSKSERHFNESLSTLRFASRASQIKNQPMVNKIMTLK